MQMCSKGLTFVFLLIFMILNIILIRKYLDKKTQMVVTGKDDGNVEYPKVTICKKFTYNHLEEELLDMLKDREKRPLLGNITDWIFKNTWDRQQVVGFLSHQGILKDNFPCNIVSGPGEGKPCVFPFKTYNSTELHYNCTNYTTTNPWCYSKTYLDHSTGEDR